MKDIVIYGASGFGMEVAWLIEEINLATPQWNIVGFVDDDEAKWGRTLYGYPVLGGREALQRIPADTAVTITIADTEVRRSIADALAYRAPEYPVLIHPSVIRSRAVTIGQGAIICAGSILTVEITIGEHVHINPGCTIGHQTTLEDYVTVYPGAHVAGNVKVGSCASLGTGCQVLQGLEIGSHSFLGAGSVAIRDIPPGVIAAGCPATIKKRRYEGTL
ncbi:MAG: acetyltransferase [Desulfomonile tiedjei]|nr:acetyltransferase [Desulfomonile tiedjei]